MGKILIQPPHSPNDVNRGFVKEDVFVSNIPKNGSNSIGAFIFGKPWRNQKWSEKFSETHLVFRNPTTRFYSSVAEIVSHRVEHGASLQEALDLVHTKFWESQYDTHLEAQVAHVHGIEPTHIYWLEDGLYNLFSALGGSEDIRENSSEQENRNFRTRIREEVVRVADVEWIHKKYENDFKFFLDMGRKYE